MFSPLMKYIPWDIPKAKYIHFNILYKSKISVMIERCNVVPLKIPFFFY